MKSHSKLPLISSPRFEKNKLIKSKLLTDVTDSDEDEDYLFDDKYVNPIIKKPMLSPTSSSVLADSRITFFESLRNLPMLSKRSPVEETVSVAYLTECHKNGLCPVPMGLTRLMGSSVNVRNYGMGDNYAKAFSKGISRVKNLEKLNVGANSLSPKGTKHIISKVSLQPLKELNLKDNQIKMVTMQPLINLIQKQTPSLKYLNLENTRIADTDVAKLCEALHNDRVLNFLGLAMNCLGNIAAKAIKAMLTENQYLKKIDLHWNNLKDSGAALLFEGLCRNDSLKELDLSWNSIGKNKDATHIQKIAHILPRVQGLAHLDLSFNYLTAAECVILGEGMRNNHDILGLHLLGNEGYIDSQGFIHPSNRSFHFEQSHLFRRIFEDAKSFKTKSKVKAKSMCWLCEQWVEMIFFWTPSPSDVSSNDQVFIHLECDEYEPDLMTNTYGRYQISRVVPQGDVKFFFSKNTYPMRSREYELAELPVPIEKSVHFNENFEVPVIMHVINKTNSKGPLCDYKQPFATIPRRPKFYYTPAIDVPLRLKWSISNSLFKDYRLLDKTLVQECLEFDWNQSKLPNWIKSSEQEEVKAILIDNYYEIIETFRFLASQSGNEYFTIGTNIFTDFLNQGSILDSMYEASDLGVNWSSVITPKDKKQPYNPGNALVRYEFTELLLRVASDRYVRNRICSTVPEALARFVKEKIKNIITIHDSNKWRKIELLTEEVDVVLKAHKPILDSIYKIYSGRKSLPGQKPFMCIEEFRQLCIDGRLIPEKLPARELDSCFSLAIMVQVDELFEKRHIEMTFVEFLEALCRVCWYFNINSIKDPEEIEFHENFKEEEPDLAKKVEKAMWNLYHLCPKIVQDNFVFPTQQTYKTFMYKFDRKPTSIREIYKDVEI